MSVVIWAGRLAATLKNLLKGAEMKPGPAVFIRGRDFCFEGRLFSNKAIFYYYD